MLRAVFTVAVAVSMGATPALVAQRGGSAIELHGTPASVTSPGVDGRPRGIPASVTDPGFTRALRGSSLHQHRRPTRDVRPLYAVPYYGYYVPLDSYVDYEQQTDQAQAAPAQAPAEEEDAKSADSSRYGEHYFDDRDATEPDEARVQPTKPAAVVPDEDSPVTTLVYLDGHKSEVRNYAIVGTNLIDLTKSPVLKKIPLSSLDLVATRKQNEDNGVEFHAP
jgi:hypothetical protein